jgi:hypothetical protein
LVGKPEMLGAHGRPVECEQAAALVNSIDDGLTLTFASWNQIHEWFKRLEALQQVA